MTGKENRGSCSWKAPDTSRTVYIYLRSGSRDRPFNNTPTLCTPQPNAIDTSSQAKNSRRCLTIRKNKSQLAFQCFTRQNPVNYKKNMPLLEKSQRMSF